MDTITTPNPFDLIQMRFNALEIILNEILEKRVSKPPDNDDEYLTMDQAADFLKYSKSLLYKYCQNGKIPFVKKGRKILFIKKQLQDWMKLERKDTLSAVQRESERFN